MTHNILKKIRNTIWTVGSVCFIFIAGSSIIHNYQMDYIRTDARTKLSQAYSYQKEQAMRADADSYAILQRAFVTAEANRIIYQSTQPSKPYISQVIVNHFTPYAQGF